MSVFHDLDQRWRLLVPPDAVAVTAVPRAAALAKLRALAPDTPVALMGGRRLRWLARRAGVRVTAEYLALPSLATPVAIARRKPETLRWMARTVLTVPSGITRLHAPAWLGVKAVRTLPGLLSRAPAGERLIVGIRS